MRKYLEKGNIILERRRKTEKEKEENIWKRKVFYCEREEKQGRKRRKIFGGGKIGAGWVDGRTGIKGSIKGPRGPKTTGC